MPTYTEKLKIPKPLGNEAVTRAKFNEVLDVIDAKAASAEEVNSHAIGLVPHLGTTTNVGGAYSITTTEEMPINKKFTITFNAAATGATTLNVSTIGTAKAIKKQNGSDLIAKAATYTLFWNGTNFQSLGEGGDFKLSNLLKNGSFENDKNCWSLGVDVTIISSSAFSGSKCIQTISSDSAPSYVYQDIPISNGHKVYITGMAYVNSHTSGVPAINASQYGTWTTMVSASANTSIIGVWQRLSTIATATNGGIRFLAGRGGTGIEATRFDALMAIDLTAAFGVGNEPSTVEMDEMVTRGSQGNLFDRGTALSDQYIYMLLQVLWLVVVDILPQILLKLNLVQHIALAVHARLLWQECLGTM